MEEEVAPAGDSFLAVRHLLLAAAVVCLECRAWEVSAEGVRREGRTNGREAGVLH